MTTTTEKPSSSRRFIALGVGILISIIFLGIAFRDLDPQTFIGALGDVNLLWLLAGTVVYALAVTVIAWRWQFLLAAFRPVPLIPLTRIVAIGYMGNNIYPFRAGEALRIFLLRRNHDVPVAGAATTVIVERIFDGIVMLSFILIGLFLVEVESDRVQTVATIAAALFIPAVIVFMLLAAFPNNLRALVERVAGFLPENLAKIVLSLSNGVIEGLSGLRSPLHLLGAAATSYTTWAIEAVVYWLVMVAFGLDLGYGAALLVVGTVNLAGLIPASPGQFGVYEFFVSTVLIALGIRDDIALAYAIVVHIVIWLPVTVAGFIFLIREGLGWSAITHAQELEPQT